MQDKLERFSFEDVFKIVFILQGNLKVCPYNGMAKIILRGYDGKIHLIKFLNKSELVKLTFCQTFG